MKKFLFTMLLAIAGVFTAWAQSTTTCVIVEFKSGETLSIALTDKPKAQFEQSEIVLTAESFEGRYTAADIKRFYFDEVALGIKAVEAADTKAEGEIYDINGRKVASYKGNIDATTLPMGVYVVKTQSGKSFKVTKK